MGALLPAIMSLRVRERLFRLASPSTRRPTYFAVSRRRAVQVVNHSVSDLRKQADRRACRVSPGYALTSCWPALRSRSRRCRRAAPPRITPGCPISATYTEEHDDRFVAALDMKEGARDFTLAYVVRAVTPANSNTPRLSPRTCTSPKRAGAPQSASSPSRRGNSERLLERDRSRREGGERTKPGRVPDDGHAPKPAVGRVASNHGHDI
jgi:hypothetical protein